MTTFRHFREFSTGMLLAEKNRPLPIMESCDPEILDVYRRSVPGSD